MDQDNPVRTSGAGAVTVAGVYDQYQIFTVGLDGLLSTVEVSVAANEDATEDLVLGIWTTTGTSFNSHDVLLDSFSVPVSVASPSYSFVAFDVSSLGLNVAVGDILALSLSSEASNAYDSINGYSQRWLWEDGNDYSGGASYFCAPEPSCTTVDSRAFKTYVSAVPIPAAAWLFGSGLLGLAAMKRKRS